VIEKVITHIVEQVLRIKWDRERFGLVEEDRYGCFKVIILNPREAKEVAEFIKENNHE